MNKYFEINRFLNLLRLELYKSRKGIGMILIITFGVLFFLSLLLSVFMERPKVYDHTENYIYALLLGGFIVSSLAFSGVDRALRRVGYLMLPVSALERFICMWLLTCIGWLVVYTLGFALYVLLANPLAQSMFPETTFKSFNVLGPTAWMTMKVYMVLQGIFLIGAAHFRGYVFPKTAVAIILLLSVLGLVLYFILKEQFLADHYCPNGQECELLVSFMHHPIWYISKGFFWFGLAPLTWVLTYLGLKDQEA